CEESLIGMPLLSCRAPRPPALPLVVNHLRDGDAAEDQLRAGSVVGRGARLGVVRFGHVRFGAGCFVRVVRAADEAPLLEIASLPRCRCVPGLGRDVEAAHLDELLVVAPTALTPSDHLLTRMGPRVDTDGFVRGPSARPEADQPSVSIPMLLGRRRSLRWC